LGWRGNGPVIPLIMAGGSNLKARGEICGPKKLQAGKGRPVSHVLFLSRCLVARARVTEALHSLPFHSIIMTQ
jgi:hypothetical protein